MRPRYDLSFAEGTLYTTQVWFVFLGLVGIVICDPFVTVFCLGVALYDPIMTCFLLTNDNIQPQKELHLSLWVKQGCRRRLLQSMFKHNFLDPWADPKSRSTLGFNSLTS